MGLLSGKTGKIVSHVVMCSMMFGIFVRGGSSPLACSSSHSSLLSMTCCAVHLYEWECIRLSRHDLMHTHEAHVAAHMGACIHPVHSYHPWLVGPIVDTRSLVQSPSLHA